MREQRTFAGEAWSGKKKITRRERFLAEMDAVMPWAPLLGLIAPHYPQAGKRGRPPMPLERMLRIYFLQQWFNLSDPAAEDALYDSETMRRFVGVELGDDAFPDETTILHFRHLLERHELTEAVFAAVQELLVAKGLLLKRQHVVFRHEGACRNRSARARAFAAHDRCSAARRHGSALSPWRRTRGLRRSGVLE